MNTVNNNSNISVEEINKDKLLFWGAPVALLVILILAFGLMLPWLGYGFDEWHFIYYFTRGSQGLAELFHYDGHPQATWSYIQSFNTLGYGPFLWHLYSLLWRWLAVLSFWLCLKRIWPNNHRQNFVVAALFAVHPIFTLQVFPISFFEIWIGYTLLFLSFFFTILAIQSPEKQRIFTVIAAALAVGHVFTREYAWFVELMRPVFIWLALPSQDESRKKIFQTARIWLPFFVIFLSSLIWRGFFYTPLRKYFQVQNDLFTNPGTSLLVWALNLLPDLSIVLVTSWYKTFSSAYVYFIRPFNIILLGLMFLIAMVGNVFVRKINNVSQSGGQWANQAILLGLPSILFGILPFYIASYSIHLTETPHNSRLAIGMLPGVALITTVFIEKIISRQSLRAWITVLVLSLAVGWHVRYTNDYRKVWSYQSNFLQQLTWRVPGIEKNTAIYVWQPSFPDIDVSDAEIALHGDFALSMAINSIYQPNPTPAESKLSYWYYELPNEAVDISRDTPLRAEHATTYFEGNTSNSLFFYYDPENNRCLHLVTPEDQHYKQYPELTKSVSPDTTTDRILPMTIQNVELRDEILGKKQNTWCFFYQKAELARQYQQWDQIPLLWKEAADNNLQTEFGTEYIPFIDGFARLGEWQKAREITIAANRLSKAMGSILCPLWDELERSISASEEKDETIKQVKVKLECANQ
ncbi:MAG TPA: hypothetical protein VK206_06995 [Anaerolineales bacterium]|nr:hypothetical protein [Anaerolineales bacterium]